MCLLLYFNVKNSSARRMHFSQGPQNFAIRAVEHEYVTSGESCEYPGPIVVEANRRDRTLMPRVLVAPSKSLGRIKGQDQTVTSTDD